MSETGIKFSEFTHKVDLEQVSDADRQEIADYFMPAAIIGLSDGDLMGLHGPTNDERLARLYGRTDFSEGEVAKKVLVAAIEAAETPGIVQDFQGFAEKYFSSPGSSFSKQNTTSKIRIFPEGLQVDENPVVLPKPPQVVLEYGSCLVSRSFINDQMGFFTRGIRPFAYSPIARTHFTNLAIMRQYEAHIPGPGAIKVMLDKRLYIGREDGVKSATDEIVEMQTQHTGRCDIADVIVCAGTQHSTPEDIKAGINNASKIIKQGGVLVVRSLARPSGDELGTEQIVNWAYESGFPENGIQFSALHQSLGHTLKTGQQGREMKTVVLTR